MDLESPGFFKGRIAEAITEAMLEEMGWKVYRYGAEFTANAVLDKKKPIAGTAAKRVRSMPDFIIQKGEDVHLIEVKYRAGGKWALQKELDKWKDPLYPEAYLILVSSDRGIMMEKAEEIYPKKGYSFDYLTSEKFKHFDFDKDTVVKYYNLAQKIFVTIEEMLEPPAPRS